MIFQRTIFWSTACACVLTALVSYRFLVLGLENSFPGMLSHIAEQRTMLLLHVISAPLALALGIFQFLPKWRKRNPGFHRWMGRTYGFAILVGGLSGLSLAYGSIDRPVAALGFGLLSLLWLATTARAIQLAITRQIQEHRVWMIRSFALTFAGVTLRLLLPFFMLGAGMTYSEASPYLAWACWVPNIIFAEWWIRRNQHSRSDLSNRLKGTG